MNRQTFIEFWKTENENYQGLIQVIEHLKTEITDDMADSPEDTPNIQITISVNKDCSTWSYQSGDNSYSGSCYGDPSWGVDYITRDCDSKELANTLINDLTNQIEFNS